MSILHPARGQDEQLWNRERDDVAYRDAVALVPSPPRWPRQTMTIRAGETEVAIIRAHILADLARAQDRARRRLDVLAECDAS